MIYKFLGKRYVFSTLRNTKTMSSLAMTFHVLLFTGRHALCIPSHEIKYIFRMEGITDLYCFVVII